MPQGLAAFRHRNYRLFYSGQLISVTGTWMQTLAQSWLVLTLTPSAFLLSLVSVFQFMPMLVLGLFAGLIADRVPKRSLLIGTQSVAMVLAGTLAVLTWTNNIDLPQIYILALLLGINNAFDMPARQAFVVEMVGKEDLTNAIALNSSLFNAARIIGPAIAGALLAAFGPAVCFGINAVSYIAVIAGLLMMRVDPIALAAAGQKRLEQIREGLRYVGNSPAILHTVLLIGCIATFGMNFNIWVPLLAKQDLNGGAGGFGLLMSSMGFGSLTGALALAFLVKSVRQWMLFSTTALLGLLLLALSVVGAIPLSIQAGMLVLALIGFSTTTTMAMANTTVQTLAPDALRGRIMSVYMTVFTGTGPLGAMVAGVIASRWGTPVSMTVGALATFACLSAIVMASRRSEARLAYLAAKSRPPVG